MKKLLCLWLTVILLLAAYPIQPAALADRASLTVGDGDDNHLINASDALLALRIAVGKVTETRELLTRLDVDGSGNINATDALLVLKFAVGKLERFPADRGTYLVDDDAQWLTMSMDEIVETIDGETPPTPVNDFYSIHSDGGLIYNPLSREVDPADLTKYNPLPKTTGSLKLADGSALSYSLPTDVTAYDMIPITYTLERGKGDGPLYVEATTFERGNGHPYDLCLPGNVQVKADYLGYVAATNDTSHRPSLSYNFASDRAGTQYPQYNAGQLISSDTVERADYVWFKFRFTNTGNTILDGDGNGTFCFSGSLTNKETGKVHDLSNNYVRLTADLYPGESTELYFLFGTGSFSEGSYSLSIGCLVRNEEATDAWGTKIWGGYQYGRVDKTITVAQTAGSRIASPAAYVDLHATTRDTWLHTYEEFTTSYDAWLSPAARQTGTLYVQPAAWSDHVALKLMRGNGLNMQAVNIPLTVETDSITITLNETAENYIVTDEGTKYPAMASQSMSDMRVNISLDPDAAAKQLDELLDMKECGINLVTTTEAFNAGGVNMNNQDSNWFMCDVIRKLGMRMEGFIGYPYSNNDTATIAYMYSRDTTVRNAGTSYESEKLAIANGLRGLYQFMRWGKNFYVNGAGKPVFNTEDTRGWMRIDYNARAYLQQDGLDAFQNWLKEKYGTIDALNEAWGEDFAYDDFSQIDPEYGTTNDHTMANYVNSSSDVWEWSAAINDLDIFRTLQRTRNYETVLNTLKNYNDTVKDIGAASVDGSVGIRTEGANVTGVVPADTDRSHLRHAYYSQRRCAIIPQILAKSGTVSMHSDYVTLPYSVSEWRELVSSSTALGITQMPLLQSNRMRDIAINAKYGDANYSIHYNLEGNNYRGAYINTQTSVFQVFKAIYESGGIPGVLWEDYTCDGYVTETQQKEMKFFSQKIAQMMQTEQAQAWATTNVPDVQSVYDLAVGGYSYDEAFLDAAIAKALQNR